MKKNLIVILCIVFLFTQQCYGLWCYQCVSTQPGCGKSLNWLWHWTKICPEDNDVCVKIEEEKDGDVFITRDCLSSLLSIRTDIPADKYEGCRPAAVDVKLANYVNNSIKELDIYRRHYEKTNWCFCFLDHRCNDGTSLHHPTAGISPVIFVSFMTTIANLYFLFRS